MISLQVPKSCPLLLGPREMLIVYIISHLFIHPFFILPAISNHSCVSTSASPLFQFYFNEPFLSLSLSIFFSFFFIAREAVPRSSSQEAVSVYSYNPKPAKAL